MVWERDETSRDHRPGSGRQSAFGTTKNDRRANADRLQVSCDKVFSVCRPVSRKRVGANQPFATGFE